MEIKQVIVLRKDLNMRKGKMVAQGAHASLAVIANLLEQRSIYNEPDGSDFDGIGEGGLFISEDNVGFNVLKEWLYGLQTKICVGVSSEQELQAIYDRAKEAGLPCSIITDAGKTEFGGVLTKTSCAIGPAECSEIDKITGHLTLL